MSDFESGQSINPELALQTCKYVILPQNIIPPNKEGDKYPHLYLPVDFGGYLVLQQTLI